MEDDFNTPATPVVPADVEAIHPDAVLVEVQTARLNALRSGAIPDKDTMMLMRDLNTTAINQKRIDVDKDSVAGEREAAANMAAVLRKITSNPFLVSGDTVGQAPPVPSLPVYDTVPDESSTEPSEITLEELTGEE